VTAVVARNAVEQEPDHLSPQQGHVRTAAAETLGLGMTSRSRPLRLLNAGERRPRSLRVAMLAPPWISVPPPAYGGIEAVVALLCDALVARGHAVTLFAAPGSQSTATVHTLLDDAHPDTIGSAMHESDHVAGAWTQIDAAGDQGHGFDVVHDHSGFTALAMADRIVVPVVHTLHGAFTRETARFYQRHGHKARLVAISRSQAGSAPPGVSVDAVVPNPIAVGRWPLRADKHDYLLWIGRMDPIKGAHRAIIAARLADRPLVLAGPVQSGQEGYFSEQVQPHIDGHRVRYVGEIGGAPKRELFAHASALLMPIRWPEPFGMVMVEALACGTPVIAFPEGAASEIVIDGHNGMLVTDEGEMARAVARLHEIDPASCRATAAERYDIAITAAGYERVYRHTLSARGTNATARQSRQPTATDQLTQAPLTAGQSPQTSPRGTFVNVAFASTAEPLRSTITYPRAENRCPLTLVGPHWTHPGRYA
jgi:glycosyltransferase involved in cell wall biosynthesis